MPCSPWESKVGPMTDLELHDQLDETNRRLLRELHADPRLSMSELGRRVGLSAPAVSERVQRLQRAGVITGFRMDVDPAALGLPVSAVALDQVSECHRITGEDCFLIKVHASSVAGLEEVLDRFLVHGQTVSSIVVTSPVPGRPLPIPD